MERDLTVDQIKELLYAEHLFAKIWGRPATHHEIAQLKHSVLQGKTIG